MTQINVKFFTHSPRSPALSISKNKIDLRKKNILRKYKGKWVKKFMMKGMRI